MDSRKYMIVDLDRCGDKRMFITESVDHIYGNGCYWTVRFLSSPRPFRYNGARLIYMTDPVQIDLDEKGLYVKNRRVSDVAELYHFTDGSHSFYHVVHVNGFTENLAGRDVYVTRTRIDRHDGSTWDYLNHLVAETGLLAEDGSNILALQYGIIDVKRDTVPLAQYLGDKTKLSVHAMPNRIYYPFGCNASQKQAVENALTHQVSIIQGPPGTGKTQTILNIIANLISNGKSVLVVSNNNSAVENVAEKLSKEGLGFIVAQLGSVDNKKKFVAEQKDYPSFEKWPVEDIESVQERAQSVLTEVSKGFDYQIQKALKSQEYHSLLTESHYEDNGPFDPEHRWILNLPSSSLIQYRHRYGLFVENNTRPGYWFRLKCLFKFGFKLRQFSKMQPAAVLRLLDSAFYQVRRTEIEKELQDLERSLRSIDLQSCLDVLRFESMHVLKHKLAGRYDISKERQKFSLPGIKAKTEDFLHEYPVVLSTTYAAKACISKDMVFDYVIMDEASQVDIKTGALALSCAENAVIVGDDKQLPNVISHEEELALKAIQSSYHVPDCYSAATHSFLQSCTEVFPDAPTTLLREHYRCHPKIIDFCNQRFYDRELVLMTSDRNEDNVLQVYRTVQGNHARGHFNQREIDTIVHEVMPAISDSGSVGIITPYRAQAQAINEALGRDIASTVHKYQGRECDTIIMSMVDNCPTAFSDDPNLLNVAISRAKRRLCIVTNGNEMPQQSNLSQLIAYIQYNNFEIRDSKIRSVFDLLYQSYTLERLDYESKHPKVSEHLSENLFYDTLTKAIDELHLSNVGILCHYPLSRLILDWSALDHQEKEFAESPYSHVDFLIYNTLTKKPLFTIEVDGWNYHRTSETQQSRDHLKDRILTAIGLPHRRISTVDTVNLETITEFLIQNI